MHGRVFEVERAHQRLEDVLAIEDPAELRNVAPWPRQSREGLAELDALTHREIQDRGWDSPPYHPLCRGLLRRTEQRFVPDETIGDAVANVPLPVPLTLPQNLRPVIPDIPAATTANPADSILFPDPEPEAADIANTLTAAALINAVADDIPEEPEEQTAFARLFNLINPFTPNN